jgi:prephenate dehydrogenase
MEDGFALNDATVGIFGLGLMGGSLALCLREHCARLIGFDSDPAALELALSKEIVDEVETSALSDDRRDVRGEIANLERIDLFILAIPVPAIIDTLQQLSSLITHPCMVMDVGSTKREILQAMSGMPENFDPIGGHPICGREKLGLENADASLYHNAPFVVTSLARTTRRAKSAARQIISTLRAKYIEMSAEDHDQVLASTSHLPFLIASSLVHCTPHEYTPLIGPGFRSTGRLAGTPSQMMMGVLKSNRDNILHSIYQFRSSLQEIESALQNEDDLQLEAILDRSRSSYLLFADSYSSLSC